MRIALSLLFCLLFTSLLALAQDSVRLKKKHYHREALNGRCVIDCDYVEVEGRPDLNAKIKALLPAPVDVSELEPGWKVSIEHELAVTYNQHGLLSIYGTGLKMYTANGEPVGAHPTKLFAGINLDIASAREYSLRDFFGADAYAKLDELLAKGAAKEAGSEEVMPLDGHTYHCYLSKTGVTFYQLYDNFVAGSLEVTLPYAQALELANPEGPLARLRR